MKRYLACMAILSIVVLFSNCHSSKKAQAAVTPKLSYETSVQTLIVANCSPCHIPAKGGNKKPLDSYASVKETIDDIINRIELEPGTRGFMPFKHAKLSDSTIAVFKQWKTDGLLEK
jgi:hypothetical protein